MDNVEVDLHSMYLVGRIVGLVQKSILVQKATRAVSGTRTTLVKGASRVDGRTCPRQASTGSISSWC